MQIEKVDITPGYEQAVIIYVSQYDVGRQFKINLTDGSESYSIPAGAVAKIEGTKESTLGFSVQGTISGNSITFTTTNEMTDEAGRIPVEISITKDNLILGSKNIYLDVEESPHKTGTYDGSLPEIIPEITILVERVEAAVAKEEVLHEAEAWAVGERNGVPVGSDDDTYHNNSKYYKEQAANSERSAATSEQTASQKAAQAATSASDADTAKTNAQAAQTAAEAAAEAAASVYATVGTVAFSVLETGQVRETWLLED